MAELSSKDVLLTQVDTAWQYLSERLASLPGTAFETPNEHGWTARDLAAHIASWEHEASTAIRQLVDGQAVEEHTDLDAWNERFHAEHQDATPFAVGMLLAETHEQLMSLLHELPSEAFSEPVVTWVASNTYEHYAEHFSVPSPGLDGVLASSTA